MKQHEIKPCLSCGKGVMHSNDITFLRVKIEAMVVDLNAVREQHGLELQIGALASVMGPDKDLAKGLGEKVFLMCLPCTLEPKPVYMLLERASELDDDR